MTDSRMNESLPFSGGRQVRVRAATFCFLYLSSRLTTDLAMIPEPL